MYNIPVFSYSSAKIPYIALQIKKSITLVFKCLCDRAFLAHDPCVACARVPEKWHNGFHMHKNFKPLPNGQKWPDFSFEKNKTILEWSPFI